MTTVVELISANDSIAFYPSPDVNGWVYDNDTLKAWYASPQSEAKINKRANAHGAFGLGQVFKKEHHPIVSGKFYGATATDALVARNRLNALAMDGNSITMRVTDELGPSTREVWLLESDTEFLYDFAYFPFDLSLVAPDPRRYGALYSATDGMPSAGGGLFWNLGTAPSGLYFDWGVAGTLGQVSFTNTGGAETFPRIEVGGAGSFAAGFRLTEIETGRELTYVQSTNFGDVVVFDSRTGRATLGSGDVTKYLTSRDWFAVPAGATRRYQVNPLGAVTGSPTVAIYVAPANM